MKNLTPNPENVNQSPIRVALYARVSTHEQALKGTSIKAQLTNLEKYCQLYGWQVVKTYKDEGYTGSNDDRPQYKLLFKDAARKEFDIAMSWKLDRFSRKQRNLLNGLETLKELGIKFVSASENLDTTTPHGQFAVQIMGTIAEFERGRIAERTAEAHQMRVSLNMWGSGKPPLGYRWLKDEKRFEIIEDEAKIVLLIFDLYANQELGMVQVTHRLTNEGCLRDGKSWNFRTIHEILHQSAYAGKHRLGIIFPPIITQELWDRTQAVLKEARKVRKDPRGWLLQGLVTCGECGRTLSCESIWHHNYVCRGRYKETHRDSRCTMQRLKRDWLDEKVLNTVLDTLKDSECLKMSIKNALDKLLDRRRSLGKNCEQIDNVIEALKAKKERLAIGFADGALSESVYRKHMTDLKQQEKELLNRRTNLDPYAQSELTDIDKEIEELSSCLSDDGWSPFGEWAKRVISSIAWSENCDFSVRKLLRLLRVHIIAYNDRVVIKGLLSSTELPILWEDLEIEAVKLVPEDDYRPAAIGLSHVFSSPAKTERKTVN